MKTKTVALFMMGMILLFLLPSCSSSDEDLGQEQKDPNELIIEKVRTCEVTYGCPTLEESEKTDIMISYSFDDVINPDDALNEMKWRTELYWYFDAYYNIISYNAYYYSKVTWDATIEHQNGYSRHCSRNIKLDIIYLGCSKNTPEKYIPKNTEDIHKTYDDIEGEWFKDSDMTGGSGDSGGNSGTTDEDNSSSSNSHQRDYLYQGSASCYKEDGTSDVLYVYKKNGGSELRASWVYSEKGLDRAATEKVHFASKSVNGVYYKYYIMPFGICYYFNW